jgi:hypothetical protein
MPRRVNIGGYRGHLIRKARKHHRCDEVGGWPERVRCSAKIGAGSSYVEGDVNPDSAGGFGHYRICLSCAGLTSDEFNEDS